MPIVAFLPAIIGAAGGIGSAMLGGGAKPTAQQKAAQNMQTGLGDLGFGAARRNIPAAEEGLATANRTLQPTLDFFRGILGDKGEALQAVSPEVSTVIGQYDKARKAAAEFGPRGGGSAITQAEAPFSASQAISNLIFGSRAGAAKALQSGAQTQAGFAQALASLGLGAGQLGENAASNLAMQSLAEQKFRVEQMTNIGKGLADVINSIIKR